MSEKTEENVIFAAGPSNHRCGYCKRSPNFFSYGMFSKSMKVETYQDLIDIGWRRSGIYLYKPDLSKMCCPTYTIRLDSEAFVPDKKQNKVLRRFQNYLDGGALNERFAPSFHDPKSDSKDPYALVRFALTEILQKWLLDNALPQLNVQVIVEEPSGKRKKLLPTDVFATSPVCISLFHALKSTPGFLSKWSQPGEISEAISRRFNAECKTLFRDALTEEQHRQWSTLMQNVSVANSKAYLNFHHSQKHLFSEEASQVLSACLKHRFELNTLFDETKDDDDSDFEDLESPPSLPEEFCFPIQRKRRFTMTIQKSAFDEEEHSLYKKYQISVHGDSPHGCSPSQFSGFLIDTPLTFIPPGNGVPEPGLGSFHMQYRIDDRLVAIGIVDILTRGLSSKYFIWDPDFASLSLGKVSALKEIELVRSLHSQSPDFRYYYMGYYIHSCPKMRYKGAYRPSELLCPESYQWVTLTKEIEQRLDLKTYSVLSAISGAQCKENIVCSNQKDEEMSIENQTVLMGDQRMSFGEYIALLESVEPPRNERKTRNGIFDHKNRVEHTVKRYRENLKIWKENAKSVASQLVYAVED